MSTFEQCPGNRPFDPDHPSCRTCTIKCISKNTAYLDKVAVDISGLMIPGKKPNRGGGPNKTETAAYHYLKMCYPGCEPRYEAITFHLERYEVNTLDIKAPPAGYTPDYLISLPDNTMICVEIKNAAYKHASYGRSRLAYRQAALEFPQFQFIWLELHGSEWVLN